jgi:hypothetical protein
MQRKPSGQKAKGSAPSPTDAVASGAAPVLPELKQKPKQLLPKSSALLLPEKNVGNPIARK